MPVRDVFSVDLIVPNETGLPGIIEDITSGILNVEIVTGNDIYEGPWQQIDTSEFTIVTRNPNMDPKINPNVKYNAIITFNDSRTGPIYAGNTFFTGYITDINVEYQRNDDPIITITGTDILGVLQRTIVTQEMYDAIVDGCSPELLETGISFQDFCLYVEEFVFKPEPFQDTGKFKYRYFFSFINGFAPGSSNASPGSEGALAYRPAAYFPKVGETILEVMNKYAQTNLDYLTIYNSEIVVYPQTKYNGAYWPPVQDPALEFPTYQFSSDPADDKPYQSILIDNGYNRVINQIEVSNESSFFVDGELQSETNNFGDYTIQESVEDWAATKARLSTILALENANNEELQRYATDIFQVIAFPSDQIQNITFNNARFEDIQNDITRSFNVLNQFVRIKHKVNDTQTIDRFYDIAGITHSISPDEWVMGYTLKPSQQEIAFTYQGQVPTIQMNALTGDTNFNFTATITDYPTEDIDYVLWDLNQIAANEVVYFYPSAFSGEKFKNGLKRTGLTQTWNFDDDGILEPYGEDNPFGRIGAQTCWVTAYLLLKNGFTIAVQQQIVVGTPEVTADFLWTQNLTNNFGQVTFTNTSYNHETGEPDSYAWNFGDGTTSALENPVHIYNPGPSDTEYDVSLTVFTYGEEGEKVYNTHTETVTLAQPTMVPDFTFTQNNQTVTFTNISTNVGFEEPDAYFWEFGDGTTSTEKNPIHTFPIDETLTVIFSVKLTTRNIWEQTANVTKTVTVTGLNESGTLPVNILRLRFDPVSTAGQPSASPLYFYMFDLKARTSNTKANLSYLKPTTRINSSNITWYEADGTVAESNDPFNLTRDSSITSNDQYGLSPFRTNTGTSTLDFKLDTSFGESTNLINDILLTFRDVGTTNNIIYPVEPRKKLFVDVPDSFGGWLNIGYYQILDSKVDTTKPLGVVTQAVKTMTPLRPMPPNIPYFKYTFNNTIASFTSMETADSYSWNFGDGTTSTLKDPVHTFPDRGTYNVTLAVTNGGVVTRTTTEPVIVEYLTPYPVRYFKLVQNLHTGTHAFDTPYIDSFNFKQDYVEPSSGNGLTFAKTDVYANEYRVGTTGEFVINPLTSPNNNRLTGSGGLRVKSLDGTYRTEWEMIADFGSAQSNLTNCSIRLGRWTATGFPDTVAAGINYSVFVTDFTGTQANIGSATWTKLGDFTPTSIPLNNSATYNIILT